MFTLKRSAAAFALVAALSLTAVAQDSGLDIGISPTNSETWNFVQLEECQTALLEVNHREEHAGTAKMTVGIARLQDGEILLDTIAFLYNGNASAQSTFAMKLQLPKGVTGTFVVQALAVYEDGGVAASRVLVVEIEAAAKAPEPNDKQPLADGDAGEAYDKSSEAPDADKEPAKQEPSEAPDADKEPAKKEG